MPSGSNPGDNTVVQDPVKYVEQVDFEGAVNKNGSGLVTSEEAQDAVGNNVGDGLSYNDSSGSVSMNSVASGNVTLSSGQATVDTGIGEGTTATFFVAFGPVTDGAEVAATIEAQSNGNYVVHIDEQNTSVGNPTVEYDVVRVR